MNVTENGVGALGNSEQRAESRRNGGSSGVHYGFIDKLTTAASPNDYEIQMKSDGSESSNVTGSWLTMIKLDDLTTDQWKYAEVDTDDTSISTSTETGASVTLGSGDWLIFAFTRWDMNSNSDAVEFQIDVDGNNKAFTRYEARDTTEVSCMMTMTAYTAASSVTASVEYSSEGTNPGLLNSRIFAIDMNAFQDHAFKQKAKGVSTTSIDNHDTNYTVDTLTHTSNTGSARDWAIFSHLTWDVASSQARMMNAIDQGGTQIIGETNASTASAPEQGQHDGADECALLLFGELASHAHNTDIDLDLVVMDNDSPGNGGIDENTIAAFTWELAGSTEHTKNLTYTGTGTAALTKQIRKGLSLSGSGTSAALSRTLSLNQALSYSGTGNASVQKAVSLASKTFSGVGTSSVAKQVQLSSKAFTGTGAAALTTQFVSLLTLTPSGGGTASLDKVAQYVRSLSIAGLGSPSFTRAVTYLRALTYGATGSASIQKEVDKLLSHSGLGSPSLVAARSYERSHNYTGTGTATLSTSYIPAGGWGPTTLRERKGQFYTLMRRR
jgi:hypothetical protein